MTIKSATKKVNVSINLFEKLFVQDEELVNLGLLNSQVFTMGQHSIKSIGYKMVNDFYDELKNSVNRLFFHCTTHPDLGLERVDLVLNYFFVEELKPFSIEGLILIQNVEDGTVFLERNAEELVHEYLSTKHKFYVKTNEPISTKTSTRIKIMNVYTKKPDYYFVNAQFTNKLTKSLRGLKKGDTKVITFKNGQVSIKIDEVYKVIDENLNDNNVEKLGLSGVKNMNSLHKVLKKLFIEMGIEYVLTQFKLMAYEQLLNTVPSLNIPKESFDKIADKSGFPQSANNELSEILHHALLDRYFEREFSLNVTDSQVKKSRFEYQKLMFFWNERIIENDQSIKGTIYAKKIAFNMLKKIKKTEYENILAIAEKYKIDTSDFN